MCAPDVNRIIAACAAQPFPYGQTAGDHSAHYHVFQVTRNNRLKYVDDMRGECNKKLLTAVPSGRERIDYNMFKHMAEFPSTYWDVAYTNIIRPSWFIH